MAKLLPITKSQALRLRKALLVVLSPLLFLEGCLQVVMWNVALTGSRIAKGGPEYEDLELFKPHTETHWTGVFMNLDRSRISINNLGLRGADAAPEPLPGEIRLAALGDSLTFGFGVDQNHTVPFVLEQELQEAVSPNVRVLNYGHPGASIFGYPSLVPQIVAERGHQGLVWEIFSDDAVPPAPKEHLVEQLKGISGIATFISGVLATLPSRSDLEWFETRYRQSLAHLQETEFPTVVWTIDVIGDHLEAVKRANADYGIPLVVFPGEEIPRLQLDIHPSYEGNQMVVERLLPETLKILQSILETPSPTPVSTGVSEAP